jgi:hypothetical protein
LINSFVSYISNFFFPLALQPSWALASSFNFHDHFYRR